jgi:LPXTG-site transpeptidase (sortase) family protein
MVFAGFGSLYNEFTVRHLNCYRKMRATTLRRGSARALLLLLGVGAVAGGFTLTSLGLYRLLDPGGGASVPSLASQHRTDPGAVYDRVPGTETEPKAVTVPPPIEPPLRDSDYSLVIDSIGVNAHVFTYGVDAERVPEVPLNGEDVAWYDFSARPGTGSNAVFAGHVTWNGRAVFYELDSVAVADRIVLRGGDGKELVYVVSESYLVDPNDPTSISVMSPTDKDVITIITCSGTFFYTGDPVFGGEYTQRRIIRASLSGLTPPVAAAGG